MVHRYSKVPTSIRIRHLNSLALNDPSRFWSKKSGWCKPLLWAYNRLGLRPCIRIAPCSARVKQQSCCQWQATIAPSSLDMLSKVDLELKYNTNYEPLHSRIHVESFDGRTKVFNLRPSRKVCDCVRGDSLPVSWSSRCLRFPCCSVTDIPLFVGTRSWEADNRVWLPSAIVVAGLVACGTGSQRSCANPLLHIVQVAFSELCRSLLPRWSAPKCLAEITLWRPYVLFASEL